MINKKKKYFYAVMIFEVILLCIMLLIKGTSISKNDPRHGVADDWYGIKNFTLDESTKQFALDALWQDIQICYQSIVDGTIITTDGVQTMSSPDTVTYYTGTIEEALNAGYLLDHLQWFYDTGSIPASFVPSSSTPQQSTNDAGATDNNTGNTSGNSTGNKSDKSTTSSTIKEVTEDTKISGDYVTTDKATVYSDYNGNSTKDTIESGTDVTVAAKTSNGYYKTTYNDADAYIKTSTAVTKEEYEAAWEEIDRVDATCTEDGKIVYTNDLSGLEKEETIPMLEHDYVSTNKIDATCTKDGEETFTCSICGDEKTEVIEASGHKSGDWEIVKKSGLLTKGEKQKVCKKCGEVLESETIDSIIPIWVVVIVVLLIIAIAGFIIAFVCRKKIAHNRNNKETGV